MSVSALGVGIANSVQQITNNSVATATGSKSAATIHQAAGDTTNFTSDQQTVQSLGQAALQIFPTRQQKVEALKQAVSGAEYQLDSAKIAVAIVNADL